MRYRSSAANLGQTESFVGSKYFPSNLRQACRSHDPKSILFDHLPIPALPLSLDEQNRLRPILDSCIQGKKLLVCVGAEDSLVPLEVSQPLLTVLKNAVSANEWYSHNDVVIHERVYDGLGHELSDEMVQDAINWVMATVAQGPKRVVEKVAKL